MKIILKLILTSLIVISFSFMSKEFKKDKEIFVVIDASHGGKDFGSINNEFTEKIIVASISQKIKELNKDKNVVLKFTRTADENISLDERIKFINEIKPDLMISLYVNNSEDFTETGFEVYISDKTATFEESNEIATKFTSFFSTSFPLRNRGVNTAKFLVLKRTNVPSMLLELGFISNDFDRNYITNDKSQNEIAKLILEFVGSLKY